MVAKPLIDGKVCDTCMTDDISNPIGSSAYMLVNALEEFTVTDSTVRKSMGSWLPNVSKHLVASGDINLLFLPDDPNKNIIRIEVLTFARGFSAEPKQQHKNASLQFSVLYNKEVIKQWANIDTLRKSAEFITGQTISFGSTEQFTEWGNLDAGRFKLNLNDSLIILVRNILSGDTIKSIFVKRIPVFPQSFDFIRFSSDKNLQDILNDESFKEGVRGESGQYFEMNSDEISLLRLRDFRVQRHELEYSFDRGSNNWQTLKPKSHRPGQYNFILLKRQNQEDTIKLHLRYTSQRQSVYTIYISVKKNFLNSTTFKIGITFLTAFILFTAWYALKKRKHAKQLQQLTLNKKETQSKLELLSGQLNPHFLFNSLNSVQNLINKQDTENANLYISEVSSFLRTIMDTGKKEYISLEEELKIEEAYMQLEQKRKDFQYEISNNCGNNLSQIEFPPLLLQPIIENSIHHGFSRDVKDPLIKIEVVCEGKKMLVRIIDNGQGFDTNTVSNGHGITIVQKRISLMNEKLKDIAIEMKIDSADKITITTLIFQNWL